MPPSSLFKYDLTAWCIFAGLNGPHFWRNSSWSTLMITKWEWWISCAALQLLGALEFGIWQWAYWVRLLLIEVWTSCIKDVGAVDVTQFYEILSFVVFNLSLTCGNGWCKEDFVLFCVICFIHPTCLHSLKSWSCCIEWFLKILVYGPSVHTDIFPFPTPFYLIGCLIEEKGKEVWTRSGLLEG